MGNKRWSVILHLADGSQVRSHVTFVTRHEASGYGKGVVKLVPKVTKFHTIRVGRRRAA